MNYSITVIVPVYNAEKTIGETLQSLLDQTFEQAKMEILLINDGSTDHSQQVCEKYADKYENVILINQDNRGVSAARNAGIKKAKGKYILFLDSDDQLAKESVQNIVAFFEQHDSEIDLLTYPITYVNDNGTTFGHWRYNLILKHEGIYDLTSEPVCFSSLTTMNVCVKNNPDFLFDESITYQEDQIFITKILVQKNKFGCVLKANYLYNKHVSGAANHHNLLKNSLLEIKKKLTIYEALKQTYPDSRRYIDALIIHNFDWRIRCDYFLPYHLKGEIYQAEVDYLRKIMDGIDSLVICKHPYINAIVKRYLLSLKKENRPVVLASNNNVWLLDATTNQVLFYRKYFDVVINKIEVSTNEVHFLGYIKGLEFQFTDWPVNLEVMVDGESITNDFALFESQFSYIGPSMKINEFYGFNIHLPIHKDATIQFFVDFGKNKFSTKLWYKNTTSVSKQLHRNYLCEGGYYLTCSDKQIIINKNITKGLLKQIAGFNTYIFKNYRKHAVIRNLLKLYKAKKRHVWLYIDSHDAIDNGYFQFEHDFPVQDGVDRYYIYPGDNKSIMPAGSFEKYGNHLIPFGSSKHKTLMVQAEKLLAAYIGRGATVPFSQKGEAVYRDLLTYDVIYLQHGVMNAKLPNMYSKEKIYDIGKIVVSTKFERDSLLHLAYEEKDILTCGMPRLDLLDCHNQSERKGKILFAPSWRKALVSTVDRVQVPLTTFDQSIYYQTYYKFLHNPRLAKFLEGNNLNLDVQLHPMFSCYENKFDLDDLPRIHLVHFSNAGEYDCCITDFSSIMFDYIYLKKPVLSYFPDREEVQGGSHTYREFCFPLEDGFMLVCKNDEELIEGIRELYRNNMRLPEKIQIKAEQLFFKAETPHRDKLYNMLRMAEKY